MTDTDARNATIEDVLRAIERHTLGPLLPLHYRQQLANPTARVMAGSALTDDDRRGVARTLAAAGDRITDALAHLGLTVPDVPHPVERAPADPGHSSRVTAAVLGADGRILVDSPFDLKDVVKALPGAKLVDVATKRRGVQAGKVTLHPTWALPGTPAAAANLVETITPYGLRMTRALRELAESHERAADARSLLADGAQLPDVDPESYGIRADLWHHQRAGVAFGEQASAMLVAVTMGGGKSIMAIALANRVQAATVLVVCPNRVRAVWRREVGERSTRSWHIEDGTRPAARKGGTRQDVPHPERVARLNHLFEDCDCGAAVHCYVVNYEALSQDAWQDWAPARKIDLVVYDEAHRLKNHLTKPNRPKRTKGPAERALGPDASAAQLAAARRADEIGPDEQALRDADTPPSKAALQAARAADKARRTAEQEAKAKRLTVSGVAARWVEFSHKRLGLSGTPMPQSPWDAFGIYRALDPGVFGLVWTPFKDRFLEMDRTNTFPKRVRPDMLGEFSAKVTGLMYRPVVDLQLPPTTDVRRDVELEPKARKAYTELDEALETDLRGWVDGGEMPDRGGDADADFAAGTEYTGSTRISEQNLLTQLLRLQQLTGGTLRPDDETAADGRRLTAPPVRVSTVKADQLAVFTGTEMTGGDLYDVGCVRGRTGADGTPLAPEPVVVYCRFRSDLDAVAEVARKAKLRYGEVSGRRGDGLGDDARMSPDVDVCAVQIQAGGTGVDLTRAAVGIWYSLGYSVSDYDQARARQNRPGQTRPVLFLHYIATDTKDEAVYAAISDRKDAIAEVLRAGGVDPAAIGVNETVPGPAPAGGGDPDAARSAVTLPWES